MSQPLPSYEIFQLGDSAITVDFGNVIDESINKRVLALYRQLSADPLPGVMETVPAYGSLTIYYDVFAISKMNIGTPVHEFVTQQMRERLERPVDQNGEASRRVTIPVCYERDFAPDAEWLAGRNGISVEELIHLHTSRQYRVYMLGFLPGFSYMGEVDEKIVVPRKTQPVTVAAGSVGIAGKQTGIYPAQSPGGWQIIGRTPLKLFDPYPTEGEPGDSFCLLHPGDIVQFTSISKNEFENH